MILSEPDSYNAMNSEYLPIKKDARTGKLRVEDSPLAYDLQGWENISRTLDDTVRSIADRMLSGEATALPLKNKKPSPACEWCEFKAICRNARV